MRHDFMRSFVLAVFVVALVACGGGGRGEVSVNSLDGAADIPVNSVFKYTFTQAVDTSTVTGDTFFMVESGEASASVSKGPFDPALCDDTKAIGATVICPSVIECKLAPAADLDSYKRYFACLGPGIRYQSGSLFEGLMATFTTAGGAFAVGGTVTGLGAGEQVVLLNNGGDDLTVTADGAFEFATELGDGASYTVTVLTAPNYKTCTVGNGTGTIAGANVANVSVVCSYSSFLIGGTVSGLAGTGLVLQNNGGDDLAVGANGSFTFATRVADGGSYSASVKTQPANPPQTCAVANGSGTVAGAAVTNISITCVTNSYNIGGTVSGLDGAVVLQDNGGDDLTVCANGSFTFASKIEYGMTYNVSVQTQPLTQICNVTNGSGTVGAADVTSVAVTCNYGGAVIFSTTSASYSGNLGGIAGADAICNGDANKPDSRTYKALIVDGTNRVACTTPFCSGGPGEHVDWVLAAGTSYYRPGLAVRIGTTNANGLFTFPLENAMVSDSSLIWAGFTVTDPAPVDWTTGNNCINWTSAGAVNIGSYGASGDTSDHSIVAALAGCDITYANLICVSQ